MQFFLWGFVKDTVFVLPEKRKYCQTNLQELCDRITAAVALTDSDMLTYVWNELDYRLDIYYISQGGHTQHFLMYEKKKTCRVSGSIDIRIIMICCIV